MINPMDLTRKQILVIGITSEVGQAIAIKLSKLGAKVIIVDNDKKKLQELISLLDGINNHYYNFDFLTNSEIEVHIKQIVKDNGLFDGFVYCISMGGVRPLALTKYENMQTMMNANCFSFVETVRCLARKNSFNRGGSIVAISSVSSIKGLKSKLAYSSSKAALDASVRCLAAELGEKKIRVNTILKGGVTTDFKEDYIKNIEDLNNDETINKQLLGEIDPEEIANTVAFLLSDSVKTITGTSIIHDSGYTL